MPRSERECKRVQQSRNWSGEARRGEAVPRGIACHFVQYVHSGSIHLKRGEARRQETRSCFFTRERYSLARANLCTAHSNEYSSLHRFYNFESPSCRSYSRYLTHTREARQGEVNFASPRLAHHR